MTERDNTLLNPLNVMARTAKLESLKGKVPKNRTWWFPSAENNEDWLKSKFDEAITVLSDMSKSGEFLAQLGGTIEEDWEDLVSPDDGEEWTGPEFRGRADLLCQRLRSNGVSVYGYRDKERRLVLFIVEWTGFQSAR